MPLPPRYLPPAAMLHSSTEGREDRRSCQRMPSGRIEPTRSEAGDAVGMTNERMVLLPGGEFLMGSDNFYPEERPVHLVAVDGLWIDVHAVTNA